MPAPILPIALMILAQAAAPADSSSQAKPAAAPAPEPRCGVPTGSDAIVICAIRPEGYRINPDIMAARRQMKANGGAPRPNNPTVRPDCTTVGPAPCMMAGVNLMGAALTAVQMAERVAQGQEIGSMFKTEPAPTEYQLYQMAKEQREAQQAAEAAAKVKAKAAAAQAGAGSVTAPGE